MLDPGLGMEAGTEYQPHITHENTEGETLGQGHPAVVGVTLASPGRCFVQLPIGSRETGVPGGGGGLGLRWGAWPQRPGIPRLPCKSGGNLDRGP